MFEPRLALASLSGESDAAWALAGADHAGAALLGGIALDEPSREAARALVARDRREFLPTDPLAFLDRQLSRVAAAGDATNMDDAADSVGHDGTASPSIRPGINIRSTTVEPIGAAAAICADHGAICELNAHCRQPELRAVGCGETLLADPDRLATFVARAVSEGPDVSVKVRAELPDVDLVAVAETIADAGATAIHIDAMDSPAVVGRVAAATDLFVIANNGVRDRASVAQYLDRGADAVSVGRPSREPDGPVLRRVARALAARRAEVSP